MASSLRTHKYPRTSYHDDDDGKTGVGRPREASFRWRRIMHFTIHHLLLVVDRGEYLVDHHPFNRRIADNAAMREHSINGKTQFLVLSHRRRGRAPSPLMNRRRRQRNNSSTQLNFSPTTAKYLVGSKKGGTRKLRHLLHGKSDDKKMSNEIRSRRCFE